MGSDHDDIPGLRAHDKGFDEAISEKRHRPSLDLNCVHNLHILCPGHDSDECCLNCDETDFNAR